MKVSIKLPEALVSEAMKISRTKTVEAVVIKGLEELIRKYGIAKIKNYRDKVIIDIDLDVLRGRKEGYSD